VLALARVLEVDARSVLTSRLVVAPETAFGFG